jgi:hypothetical protein
VVLHIRPSCCDIFLDRHVYRFWKIVLRLTDGIADQTNVNLNYMPVYSGIGLPLIALRQISGMLLGAAVSRVNIGSGVSASTKSGLHFFGTYCGNSPSSSMLIRPRRSRHAIGKRNHNLQHRMASSNRMTNHKSARNKMTV